VGQDVCPVLLHSPNGTGGPLVSHTAMDCVWCGVRTEHALPLSERTSS
jgi:hypothetical protein